MAETVGTVGCAFCRTRCRTWRHRRCLTLEELVMLREDDVVLAVSGYLEAAGWTIESLCLGHKRGDDVVAVRAGVRFLVEAKGEGSGTLGKKRYGQTFDGGQVHDHVAKAVLRALRWVAAGSAQPAVAFPDNAQHRSELAKVQPALDRLGITVMWVDNDRSVRLEGAALR